MKRIICVTIAALMTFSCMNVTLAQKDVVNIYVSPDGNDDNPGTIEAPLKTLDKARITVQKYIDSGSEINVIFRGGEYRMDTGVNFTISDSGKKDNPVIYKAYEGERVEFKGSVLLDTSKAKQVTDEKILSKLYDDVKNKIVEIDLTDCGITKAMLKEYKDHSSQHSLAGGEVNGLYQNNNAQTVSEWPNGFGNYTSWDYAEAGDTFHYSDTQPNRWKDAKYILVGGYNSYDYQYSRKTVKKVNTVNSTITCYGTDMEFKSPYSRRWKAFNLLEEIDVPGEYYIDPDTLKLYWYPEESLSDSKVEIAVNKAFLNIQHAENITFENLCFTQCRETAITMKQVKNIDFIGCEISNAGHKGMYVYSDIQAETDKDYWMRCMLDGSYECDISGCSFENLGHTAIEINGGNVDTLKKSNNRIENNVITRNSQLARNSPAIYISGCGIELLHNNISNMPYHAINILGNDHVLKYNEIYDVIQEVDDCGAIYAGRNTLQRGTEIAYNYIHDIMPTRELVFGFQGGVYLDDCTGGFSIHHNIIENAGIDYIINGGVDIELMNNTSVNIDRFHFRIINGGIAENHNSGGGVWRGYIADEQLYFSRYKNLKELIEMGKINTRDENMARFTKVIGNLGVDYTELSIGTNTLKHGTVKDNIQLTECNDFVDPENGDYRIKKDSETYKKLPELLNEDFDISLIGVQKEHTVNGEKSGFSQLYPKNGQQGINSSKVNFAWQNAYGANKYRLVIATDKELKNIVYDNNHYYTKTTIECLESNKVYYWKVYAENISLDYSSLWESESPVFSFATSLYDVLDTAHLKEVSEKTKQTLATLEIGEEPGQYPPEIKTKVTGLLNLAGIMANTRIGMLKQKNIDNMATLLAGSFSGIGQTNKGYVDLSKYFGNAENWSKPVNVNTDGSVTVSRDTASAANLGIGGLGHMAGSAIYSFDARLNIPSTYVIFGINKDVGVEPYGAANTGYSFLFKPKLIELHVTNGTSQVIAETVEHEFANDGNFHKIQYGYVNTDIGNIVILYVDGQRVIEYLDVINQAVKVPGTFMMHFAKAGVSVNLRKTEKIGTKEELDLIVKDALYRSAKEIIGSYETGVMVMQENGRKIFTPEGVYDTEGVIVSDGVMMIPIDAISKVLGAEVSRNGNEIEIKAEGKNIVFIIGENSYMADSVRTEIKKGAEENNGVARVPVEELLKAMSKPYYYSQNHGILVVGNIIYMNNINPMNKTRLLMNMMKDMPETSDYIFKEHE